MASIAPRRSSSPFSISSSSYTSRRSEHTPPRFTTASIASSAPASKRQSPQRSAATRFPSPHKPKVGERSSPVQNSTSKKQLLGMAQEAHRSRAPSPPAMSHPHSRPASPMPRVMRGSTARTWTSSSKINNARVSESLHKQQINTGSLSAANGVGSFTKHRDITCHLDNNAETVSHFEPPSLEQASPCDLTAGAETRDQLPSKAGHVSGTSMEDCLLSAFQISQLITLTEDQDLLLTSTSSVSPAAADTQHIGSESVLERASKGSESKPSTFEMNDHFLNPTQRLTMIGEMQNLTTPLAEKKPLPLETEGKLFPDLEVDSCTETEGICASLAGRHYINVRNQPFPYPSGHGKQFQEPKKNSQQGRLANARTASPPPRTKTSSYFHDQPSVASCDGSRRLKSFPFVKTGVQTGVLAGFSPMTPSSRTIRPEYYLPLSGEINMLESDEQEVFQSLGSRERIQGTASSIESKSQQKAAMSSPSMVSKWNREPYPAARVRRSLENSFTSHTHGQANNQHLSRPQACSTSPKPKTSVSTPRGRPSRIQVSRISQTFLEAKKNSSQLHQADNLKVMMSANYVKNAKPKDKLQKCDGESDWIFEENVEGFLGNHFLEMDQVDDPLYCTDVSTETKLYNFICEMVDDKTGNLTPSQEELKKLNQKTSKLAPSSYDGVLVTSIESLVGIPEFKANEGSYLAQEETTSEADEAKSCAESIDILGSSSKQETLPNRSFCHSTELRSNIGVDNNEHCASYNTLCSQEVAGNSFCTSITPTIRNVDTESPVNIASALQEFERVVQELTESKLEEEADDLSILTRKPEEADQLSVAHRKQAKNPKVFIDQTEEGARVLEAFSYDSQLYPVVHDATDIPEFPVADPEKYKKDADIPASANDLVTDGEKCSRNADTFERRIVCTGDLSSDKLLKQMPSLSVEAKVAHSLSFCENDPGFLSTRKKDKVSSIKEVSTPLRTSSLEQFSHSSKYQLQMPDSVMDNEAGMQIVQELPGQIIQGCLDPSDRDLTLSDPTLHELYATTKIRQSSALNTAEQSLAHSMFYKLCSHSSDKGEHKVWAYGNNKISDSTANCESQMEGTDTSQQHNAPTHTNEFIKNAAVVGHDMEQIEDDKQSHLHSIPQSNKSRKYHKSCSFTSQIPVQRLEDTILHHPSCSTSEIVLKKSKTDSLLENNQSLSFIPKDETDRRQTTFDTDVAETASTLLGSAPETASTLLGALLPSQQGSSGPENTFDISSDTIELNLLHASAGKKYDSQEKGRNFNRIIKKIASRAGGTVANTPPAHLLSIYKNPLWLDELNFGNDRNKSSQPQEKMDPLDVKGGRNIYEREELTVGFSNRYAGDDWNKYNSIVELISSPLHTNEQIPDIGHCVVKSSGVLDSSESTKCLSSYRWDYGNCAQICETAQSKDSLSSLPLPLQNHDLCEKPEYSSMKDLQTQDDDNHQQQCSTNPMLFNPEQKMLDATVPHCTETEKAKIVENYMQPAHVQQPLTASADIDILRLTLQKQSTQISNILMKAHSEYFFHKEVGDPAPWPSSSLSTTVLHSNQLLANSIVHANELLVRSIVPGIQDVAKKEQLDSDILPVTGKVQNDNSGVEAAKLDMSNILVDSSDLRELYEHDGEEVTCRFKEAEAGTVASGLSVTSYTREALQTKHCVTDYTKLHPGHDKLPEHRDMQSSTLLDNEPVAELILNHDRNTNKQSGVGQQQKVKISSTRSNLLEKLPAVESADDKIAPNMKELAHIFPGAEKLPSIGTAAPPALTSKFDCQMDLLLIWMLSLFSQRLKVRNNLRKYKQNQTPLSDELEEDMTKLSRIEKKVEALEVEIDKVKKENMKLQKLVKENEANAAWLAHQKASWEEHRVHDMHMFTSHKDDQVKKLEKTVTALTSQIQELQEQIKVKDTLPTLNKDGQLQGQTASNTKTTPSSYNKHGSKKSALKSSNGIANKRPNLHKKL